VLGLPWSRAPRRDRSRPRWREALAPAARMPPRGAPLLVHRRNLAPVRSLAYRLRKGSGGSYGRGGRSSGPTAARAQAPPFGARRGPGRSSRGPGARSSRAGDRRRSGRTRARARSVGQHEAGDEGRRAVSGLPRRSASTGRSGADSARSPARNVRRGRAPSSSRRGGERLRHGRVGLPEAAAPRRESVESRRLDTSRIRADRVGPRRVQRDEQDRGRSSPRRRRLVAHSSAAASSIAHAQASARRRPPPAADVDGSCRILARAGDPRRRRPAAFVLGLRIRALLQTVP